MYLFLRLLTFALLLGLPALAAPGSRGVPGPALKYVRYLRENPRIEAVIKLRGAIEKVELLGYAAELETHGRLPEVKRLRWFNAFRLNRTYHLRRVAFALWLEVNRLVPWSLADYGPYALAQLLGDEAFMEAPDDVRPWSAELVTAFERGRAEWLRPTRRETVIALTQWVRDHVEHKRGEAADPESWVEMMGARPLGSCQNTGDFMAVAAMALNIPVRTSRRPPAGHRDIDFPSEDLALVHTDDPGSRSWLTIPVSELFISGEERSYYLKISRGGLGAETSRYAWVRRVHVQLRHPVPEFLAAACRSREGALQWLYETHRCQGNCPTLSDYAADVERLIDAHLDRLIPEECRH